MSPPPVDRTVHLPRQTDSPALARRFLAEVLQGCDRQDWRSAAELAVTELVTNAVLHAHTEAVIRARCDDQSLRVEVEDFNTRLPVQRPSQPEASTGRGMALVAALTNEHGVTPTTHGKIVWFVLTDEPVAEISISADELMDAWADPSMFTDPAEDVGGAESRRVVLAGFPPTLWLAAAQQHDALLRELALYRAGLEQPVDDLAAADRARASITGALELALRTASEAGETRSPLPAGHPAPLDAVPPVLDLTVPVPVTGSADFAVLQDVLDEAQRLAQDGHLLVYPALPEIVAVRDWAADQVVAALAGQPPRTWPGADYFEEPDPSDGEVEFDAVPAGGRMAIVVDARNRIVGIGEELAHEIGWKVEDLVGRRVIAIVPPAFREAHTAGFTRHLTTGEAHALGVELHLPVLAADGTEVPYVFFIEADQTRSGRPIYIARLRREGEDAAAPPSPELSL